MKAFDKVSHKWLVKILKYCSLPVKVIDWIKSFLTNRKQRVLVNGIAPSWHDVISSVPQGSVLGPILFVIYINILIGVVQHSDLFLFPDDNKLFKIIFNKEDTITAKRYRFNDFFGLSTLYYCLTLINVLPCIYVQSWMKPSLMHMHIQWTMEF